MLFFFFVVLSVLGLWVARTMLSKPRAKSSDARSTGESRALENHPEKPFPNSRPPNGESINPRNYEIASYNVLERDLPRALDDRYVYWEDEEGLHRFDEQSEWEVDDEYSDKITLESVVSPVFRDFPEYDYSMDYSLYKRWKMFCVKHNATVPFGVFVEFDEGESPNHSPLDKYLD